VAAPQGVGLLEHRVDQRRLPVVDVSNDGNVAEFHKTTHLNRFELNREARAGSMPFPGSIYL